MLACEYYSGVHYNIKWTCVSVLGCLCVDGCVSSLHLHTDILRAKYLRVCPTCIHMFVILCQCTDKLEINCQVCLYSSMKSQINVFVLWVSRSVRWLYCAYKF